MTAKSRKGFTMVELLVVMGIIILLVSIAIPAYRSALDKAKDAEVKSGVHSVQVALEQFAVDNNAWYPGIDWREDANHILRAGSGVLGATENTTNGATQYTPSGKNVFTIPTDPRDLYEADGQTPKVRWEDDLMERGYLQRYPPNPFLKTSDNDPYAQMTNLMMLRPPVNRDDSVSTTGGTLVIDASNNAEVDWNRYTPLVKSIPPSSGQGTMKTLYDEYGRGNFTYVPLNPVINPPLIAVPSGTTISVSGWDTLSNQQRAEFYKYCRSYWLIGWGHTRLDDTFSKGISHQYWNASVTNPYMGGTGGFDLDRSLSIDFIEGNLAGILAPEQVDASGNSGQFGTVDVTGVPDIDRAFDGAVMIVRKE
jgi:prepilin-type N-terminal cleavage/methylation domain-containing protein